MTLAPVLSKAETRKFIIEAQLLLHKGLSSLDIIRGLGYIQIDTLAVAERSHHHVFHTRNPGYKKPELAAMLKKRQVFEYWSHAASFLPIEDYRYSLIRKQAFAEGKEHWFEQDKKVKEYVLERIKQEGPLQSKDFKDPHHASGAWYSWKPAKVALEQLFMEGKLMVSERINFQKVYDLTERVLPSGIDTSVPTIGEFCEHLIKKTLSAQGVAALSDITYLRKGIKPQVEKSLKKLIADGQVMPVAIEGVDKMHFALPTDFNQVQNRQVHIFSPFDNLIIQRRRTQEIIGFDYQLECYVPEKKRKFGYYCLPVLFEDRFVARFDPKADRKTGLFTIKSFWFEPDFVPNDDFLSGFVKTLKAFMTFCGCKKLEILKSRNNKALKAIQQLVNTV
jgi:uncharacterized protein YcaQ